MKNSNKSNRSEKKLKIKENRTALVGIYESIMASKLDFRTRIYDTIKTTGILSAGTLVRTMELAEELV